MLPKKWAGKKNKPMTNVWEKLNMGTVAMVVYKWLAAMIAEKHGRPCIKTMQWIRCRLNFSLLCSAIMCLHGSRLSRHHPSCHHISGGSIDLACSMGRVPIQVWTFLHEICCIIISFLLSLDVSLCFYRCPFLHSPKKALASMVERKVHLVGVSIMLK